MTTGKVDSAKGAKMLRKSGFDRKPKGKNPLRFGADDLGQSCPQHCPQHVDPFFDPSTEPLGTPLSVREAASLIGCSPWTVRQKYLPAGLPHLRLGPTGKLVFYRNQIVNWILEKQKNERR